MFLGDSIQKIRTCGAIHIHKSRDKLALFKVTPVLDLNYLWTIKGSQLSSMHLKHFLRGLFILCEDGGICLPEYMM